MGKRNRALTIINGGKHAKENLKWLWNKLVVRVRFPAGVLCERSEQTTDGFSELVQIYPAGVLCERSALQDTSARRLSLLEKILAKRSI